VSDEGKPPTGERKHVRAPIQLSVSYRTTGAFLVAYTVNLSKGGIFVEAEPLAVGTEVHLKLAMPEEGPLDVVGVVTWVRPAGNPDGLPVGMGIMFSSMLDEKHGEVIDRVVSGFEGLEILLMGSTDRRALLSRYAASILSCETVEVDSRDTAATVLDEKVDLAIIDLDTSGPDGLEVVRLARAGSPPTPIIVLASEPDQQQWARDQGVDQVVRAPPTFNELQGAVISALSRATPTETVGPSTEIDLE
jgi:uncharacterized protein (TIGR02266 family)